MLLVLSAAAVILPSCCGATTTYTLATTAQAPADLVAALDAAAATADFTVRYEVRADDAGVRQAVRDGDATAGLVGDTLYTSMASGTFPVLVAQSMVALEASRRLIEAGLSPAQIADVQSVQPPPRAHARSARWRTPVRWWARGRDRLHGPDLRGERHRHDGRHGEVHADLRGPAGGPATQSGARGNGGGGGGRDSPPAGSCWSRRWPWRCRSCRTSSCHRSPAATWRSPSSWFVLGFVLYAFFAAAASLVDKITEVSSAILPVTLILTVSYLIAITVVAAT